MHRPATGLPPYSPCMMSRVMCHASIHACTSMSRPGSSLGIPTFIGENLAVEEAMAATSPAPASAWAPSARRDVAPRRCAFRAAQRSTRTDAGAECSCSSLRLEPRWFSHPPLRKCMQLGAIRASAERGDDARRFYVNITGFPFPLGPFLRRRTIRREVEKGRIWVFEQEQALGFSSVSTNTRMTVIKLQSGDLWVHAPVAPTEECVQLLAELQAPVRFIVLPTFAYEHKIFVGPFSRKFPRAQVWVAPRQWSWPLNLPLEFFGIFRARILRDGDADAPWYGEIQQKVLSSSVGIGPYVEVAFFHTRSQTLLVTDAVILVPERPPEVVTKESLLAAAKNGLAVRILSRGKQVSDDPVVDTAENRQRGWERMVLQILFLGPSDLLEPGNSFGQVSNRLIVSPIVKTLVFSKLPETVREWVDAIVRDWKFKRIIPAHFAAPISATGSDLLAAFAFLDDLLAEGKSSKVPIGSALVKQVTNVFRRVSTVFSEEDMKTLASLDNFLVSVGAVKKTVAGRKAKL